MRRHFLAILLTLPLLAGYALADEWTRTYQVGDKPSLRVDTNDAAIEVSRGPSRVISVRVIAEAMSVGAGGVHVIDHQNGDAVDVQVHLPRDTGMHFSWRNRAVRVEVQAPPETTLDLHSGDGHINVDGTSGAAKLDTGDGHIEVRNFNGSLHAHTSDGRMTIDGVFTELELRTGDGHIDFTARPGSKMSSSWLIRTSDGRVEAHLPAGFGRRALRPHRRWPNHSRSAGDDQWFDGTLAGTRQDQRRRPAAGDRNRRRRDTNLEVLRSKRVVVRSVGDARPNQEKEVAPDKPPWHRLVH